jgi:DNA polymerase III subunit delta
MQLSQQQLPSHLNKTLSNIYLLPCDETLLIQESKQDIEEKAHQTGYHEKEIFFVDNQLNISDLKISAETDSLFSEKRILDIRVQADKYPKAFQQWLLEYCDRPNSNILMIISSNKLTAAQKKARWHTAIEKTGVILKLWPVAEHELPRWIKNRLQQRKIQASSEAIRMLAYFTSGNLLATHQCINKLQLLYPSQAIGVEEVKFVIHDNAKFNIFDESQSILQGDLLKSQRVLNQLKFSGTEPTLILWSIAREARLLHEIIYLKDQKKPYQSLINSQWKSRQQLIKNAVSRLSLAQVEKALNCCEEIDRSIKGLSNQGVWQLLNKLVITLCQHHKAKQTG